MKNTILLFFLYNAVEKTLLQKIEGDACVDENTKIVGKCTLSGKCETAKTFWKQNGIRPTFCSYTFDDILVCCLDGTNILQTPGLMTTTRKPETTPPPNDPVLAMINQPSKRKRISEIKCEEYSRPVTQTFSFVPLIPDAVTQTISTAKCTNAKVELIVGGEDASLGEFPHMAAIGWAEDTGYEFNCGGSLISPKWVLTAGHCTFAPKARDPAPAIVRLGDLNINPSVNDGAEPIDVPIKSIEVPSTYNPPKRYDDIALLELSSSVPYTRSIRPACLWPGGAFLQRRAVATGWGVSDTDARIQKPTEVLQKVSLTLFENDYCNPLLSSVINRNWQGFASSQLCAGELTEKKDTCQGDSGAPLQISAQDNPCKFYIIGLTSFGQKCAEAGKPAVYTRVSSYLDWIESLVWPGE